MFSKAKMGLILGTMAAVLSVGSVFAAESTQQQATNNVQQAKDDHVKDGMGKLKWFMGKHDHKFGKEGASWENQDLLTALKLTADQLKTELKAGKSLAEIATAQGVSEDTVIQLLTKQRETQLETAVKDGKLTQEQADKIKANLAEKVKAFVENTHQPKGEGWGKGHAFLDSEELLTALKLTADQLKTELKAGKSLAEIATAQGVSEDSVIQLLTKQRETQLETAVKDGKLTQEQADKIKANLAEKVKAFVENKHQAKGEGWGKEHAFWNNEELLTALKLTADQLQTELKSGKSLAEIATAQGVTEDAVIQVLTKQFESRFDEMVKNGKLSQEKIDQMKEKMKSMVQQLVEKKFTFEAHKNDKKE